MRKLFVFALLALLAISVLLFGGWIDGYRHAVGWIDGYGPGLAMILPLWRLRVALLFDDDDEDWVEGHALLNLNEDE